MIILYRSTEAGLVTVDALSSGCWLNAVAPTPQEVALLQEVLNVPQDFITSPLDLDERARSERENGATLIVLRVPHFQGDKSNIPYITIPVGVVLTDKFIATISKIESHVIQELIGGRPRGLSTAKRNRFLLHLLLIMAHSFLRDVRHINKAVDVLEDRLEKSLQNREVLELLKYQKSLVYFTTALNANELILSHLQKIHLFQQYPDDEDLLEDVVTEVQQAIDMINISSNILSQMMDAFASIISNNLNVVMKFLASVTIILSLPTMVASFYGMNVKLPGEELHWAFLFILLVSVTVSLLVLAIFWRKDWL